MPEIDNIQEEVFARGLAKNGFNAGAAGKDLYDDRSKGWAMAKKHSVQVRARELMYENGLALEDLVLKHKELLEADKAMSTKFGIEMVPDRAVQIKALELAYTIWGATSAGKEEPGGPQTHKFEIDKEGITELKGILDELKDLNLKKDVIDAEIE